MSVRPHVFTVKFLKYFRYSSTCHEINYWKGQIWILAFQCVLVYFNAVVFNYIMLIRFAHSQAFRVFDKDGSGFVSSSELKIGTYALRTSKKI